MTAWPRKNGYLAGGSPGPRTNQWVGYVCVCVITRPNAPPERPTRAEMGRIQTQLRTPSNYEYCMYYSVCVFNLRNDQGRMIVYLRKNQCVVLNV